jgi:putative transposase
MKLPPDPHYRHRFPAEIIGHAVWLHYVFSLSFRDVELLLAERGVMISYVTVRRWCRKFSQTFAGRLRRRRPVTSGTLMVCREHISEVGDVELYER